MFTTFLFGVLVLCGLAVLSSVILHYTAQKFAIKTSSQVEEIYNLLPHANCGACGKAGCHDFAKSCATSTANSFADLRCPVGGDNTMKQIASILGFSSDKKGRSCAVLRCNGTCKNAPDKITYTGLKSCRVANMVSSGESGCPNGCLRFGDCVKVCKFGALSIDPVTEIPTVDYKKCTSCGACVKMCPRSLFEIRKIEENSQLFVACRNQQKGALARKNCTAACIACGKCVKITPQITITDNLSYIPSSVSPTQYGEKLAKECPVNAIHYRNNMVEEGSNEI